MHRSSRITRRNVWARRALMILIGLLVAPAPSSASILDQVAPTPTSYMFGPSPTGDFLNMAFSPLASVTAAVTAVDIQLGLGNTTTSGCEAFDFAGFPAGNIALIQRGFCEFEVKAENAAAAGALGVLIFNQGNTAARLDVISGTLEATYSGGIPVLGLSYGLGALFAGTQGLVVHMEVNADPVNAPEPGPFALLLTALLSAAMVLRRQWSTKYFKLRSL
jgi:hypothetical protein